MAAAKVVIALYLVLVGAAVAVNFIVSLFYDPATDDIAATVWRILDPMMVAGLLIVMILALRAKRLRDADSANISIDRRYLEANLTYYSSVVLLLALLWNWISSEWVEPAQDIGLLWIFVNISVSTLLSAVGTRLLRSHPSPKQ